MSVTGRGAPAQSPTVDREIVVSRTIDAPPELVFEAFTEVRHVSRWWGPEGFPATTRSFEFRVGGEWDFVMHGPDGTDYPEWITWTEISPPERIALLHGESRGDPNTFESVLTFEPDGAATRVEMHTVFPTKQLTRRGGRDVPRNRGRRADPEQPGRLRHRVSPGSESTTDGREDVASTCRCRWTGSSHPSSAWMWSLWPKLTGWEMTDPDVQLWMSRWTELQQWMFPQRFIRENLGLGQDGEEGRDGDVFRETFERTGATVLGKRMFDLGERSWPADAPYHTPVFVVTHEKRDPWKRPGGTTFHFVNDGIEAALDQARAAAGHRDVRVAGGGQTILEYVNAGLVDEFSIALSPVLLGSGIRLFDGVDASRVALEPVRAEPSPRVTPPDLFRPRALGARTRGPQDSHAVGYADGSSTGRQAHPMMGRTGPGSWPLGTHEGPFARLNGQEQRDESRAESGDQLTGSALA